MIVPRKAHAVSVDQPRPLPPESLGQQKAALPREVQGRGVELDVLHSGEGGAGPERHGESGTFGTGGVGGVGVKVAEATGSEDGGRGVDRLQVVVFASAADADTIAIDAVLGRKMGGKSREKKTKKMMT